LERYGSNTVHNTISSILHSNNPDNTHHPVIGLSTNDYQTKTSLLDWWYGVCGMAPTYDPYGNLDRLMKRYRSTYKLAILFNLKMDKMVTINIICSMWNKTDTMEFCSIAHTYILNQSCLGRVDLLLPRRAHRILSRIFNINMHLDRL